MRNSVIYKVTCFRTDQKFSFLFNNVIFKPFFSAFLPMQLRFFLELCYKVATLSTIIQTKLGIKKHTHRFL